MANLVLCCSKRCDRIFDDTSILFITMSDSLQNPGELKTLNILHKAMLMGLVMFTSIAFALVYSGMFKGDLKGEERILQVLAIVLSAGGFYAGSFIFKKKLNEIKESSQTLKEKMSAYRSASIIQWALIDGPAIFSVIGFLLTANYAFFMLDIVLMAVFAMLAPSKMKIVFQLQLSQQEAEEL
jgi:hypothetical protein